ncbi:MAG: hypothetical protein AAFV26_06045 [Pseudomonadota bacterium]
MTSPIIRAAQATAFAAAAFATIGTTTVATTTAAEAKPKIGFSLHIGHPGYYHGPHYGRWRPYRPCRWLRRKARRTGSPYWWRRYRRCMWRHF